MLRLASLLIAALLALALPARAGAPAPTASVRGSVELLRKQALRGLAPAADRRGAVVWVSGFRGPAPAQVAFLNQRDEQFEPRLLPVVAGQTVSFPNQDRIYHNVFSVSPAQPFDLGQYKSSDAPRSVSFERAGLVPVYCNIHPQMISYVLVLENAAFAVTGADGGFAIGGLPAGSLTVNAWIPGAQRVSQAIEARPGETAELRLELRETERIQPHKRKDGSDYPKERYGEE